MDDSFLPQEFKWTEADQAKFGTPSTDSIKRPEETKGGWEINGLEATKAEVERAGFRAILLNSAQNPSLATNLAQFMGNRNRNLLDDIVTFSILEYHELPDGFWGHIDLVTLRDGAQSYQLGIWIAPPDSETNYGTSSGKYYDSLEEARAHLLEELQNSRLKGLRSALEGGASGQPVYFSWDSELRDKDGP